MLPNAESSFERFKYIEIVSNTAHFRGSYRILIVMQKMKCQCFTVCQAFLAFKRLWHFRWNSLFSLLEVFLWNHIFNQWLRQMCVKNIVHNCPAAIFTVDPCGLRKSFVYLIFAVGWEPCMSKIVTFQEMEKRSYLFQWIQCRNYLVKSFFISWIFIEPTETINHFHYFSKIAFGLHSCMTK